MPSARPLPKKHAAAIQDSLADVKCLVQRLGFLLEQLPKMDRPAADSLNNALQEIRAGLYAVALRLSEVEIARSCDSCPSAPAHTSAEIYLALLSQKLRQMSDEIWQTTQSDIIHLYDEDSIC